MFLTNGKIISKKVFSCFMCLNIINIKASTTACGFNAQNPVVSQSEDDIQNPDTKQEFNLVSLKMKNKREDQNTQSKDPSKDDQRKFDFLLVNETLTEDLQKFQNNNVEIKPDIKNWKGEWYLYEDEDFKKITSKLKASIENIKRNYERYFKEKKDDYSRFEIKCPGLPIKFSELEKPNKKLFKNTNLYIFSSPPAFIPKREYRKSFKRIQSIINNNVFYSSAACRDFGETGYESIDRSYCYKLILPKDMNKLKILIVPYLALFVKDHTEVYVLILNEKQEIVGHGNIVIFDH